MSRGALWALPLSGKLELEHKHCVCTCYILVVVICNRLRVKIGDIAYATG